MEQNADNEFAETLALALIYLSSWSEKELDTEIRRAWKGYDFALLDRLKEEGLIDFSYKTKSLYLTEEGVKMAQEAIERLKKSVVV